MADHYFQGMARALRTAGIFQPCLVLDLDRLDANIAAVKAKMAQGTTLRLVDKSLPSIDLIEHVCKAFDTKLVMTFHAPVTLAVLQVMPDAEMLYGKPMPVDLARQVLASRRDAAARINWLIDTPERLRQYAALAAERDETLRFVFEVDVGLHRGGLATPQALADALALLAEMPGLRCRGVMAYEAHIGHIPGFLGGPEKARRKSIALLNQYVAMLGKDQREIINFGGSTTALTYDRSAGANELSIGSAFVKPTDFDVPSLTDLLPAVFIAAPILKVVDAQLPGLDGYSSLAQRLGLLPRRGCYTYGGKWMAKPVYPVGMKSSSSFGFSTNQQFWALPDNATVKPDDFAFFRPTQSEFVLQQFGSIRVFSKGKIAGTWPALPFS